MLRLHNTITRRKETFKPLVHGQVSLYVCGITVYDYCHIGHARAMVVYDMLYRHLLQLGYAVRYVRNITDIDDKIINRAAEKGESPEALAQRFIDVMHEDERSLGVLRPTLEPRATDSIEQMHELIQTLLDQGHAYVGDSGDVLYSVQSFAGYGRLSGRRLDELRAGERVAIDQGKRDPLDFVLWKSAKPGEPSWPSAWGPGRPGWHTECCAMVRQELGITIDIHGGGMDLQFPHHDNEIAQSEAAHAAPLARFWVHNGLINTGDEKMSKSLGNFLTIRQALEQFTGEDLRFFILGSHYRSPLAYTQEALVLARASVRRLYTALRGHDLHAIDALAAQVPDALASAAGVGSAGARAPDAVGAAQSPVGLNTEAIERFETAMNDDLNTVEAIAVLHELARSAQREASNGAEPLAQLATLRHLGARLGLLQQDPQAVLQGGPGSVGLEPTAIEALIAERNQARTDRDWARSDAIRDQLAEQGVQLEDSGDKTLWRRTR